jgi:hypothetical protein
VKPLRTVESLRKELCDLDGRKSNEKVERADRGANFRSGRINWQRDFDAFRAGVCGLRGAVSTIPDGTGAISEWINSR